MLSCLYKCVAASAQLPLEVAVDVILTLQVEPLADSKAFFEEAPGYLQDYPDRVGMPLIRGTRG